MAVKFINGEHHRNPSGFYNKVKYLLSESKRDPEKLYQIFKDLSYHGNIIDDCRYKQSWEAAYIAAELMIEHNADNPRDYLNSIYIYEREKRKTWYEKLCLK